MKIFISISIALFLIGCSARSAVKKTGDGDDNINVTTNNTSNVSTNVNVRLDSQSVLDYFFKWFPKKANSDKTAPSFESGCDFDSNKVIIAINGVNIFPTELEVNQPVSSIGNGDSLHVSVVNGSICSLENIDIILKVEGITFQNQIEMWQFITMPTLPTDEAWKLGGESINPSDATKKPISYFYTGFARIESSSAGQHNGWIRIQSKDKREIIRKFTLTIK